MTDATQRNLRTRITFYVRPAPGDAPHHMIVRDPAPAPGLRAELRERVSAWAWPWAATKGGTDERQ